MKEKFNDNRLRFFLGDIRDRERLRRAFEGVDVVIQAAALKRIEACAYNPSECTKTNVIGSMNVIEAAHDAGVKKVVALSTDKAFFPVSAYGHSKALAESLFLAANNSRGANGPHYAVTRYGNVAFSRGSIIPKWLAKIEKKQTVEITNPLCTRFWMEMHEAVSLVDKAVAEMPTEVLLPELRGFCINDLATAMGVSDINMIGLPKHEKMHEGLADGVFSNTVPQLSVDELYEKVRNATAA